MGRYLLIAALVLALGGGVQAAENGLLFHAGFEGSTEAFSLSGAGKPVAVEGPQATFQPGKVGQALLCGAELTLLKYRTEGNLVPQAGSVSLWVKPLNWGEDGNFHSFFESGEGSGRTGWKLSPAIWPD